MIRLCDLRDKPIRTLDGKRLGRVHEVHCEEGRITALMCGPGSWIERMTSKTDGHRIPWESVRRIDAKAVIVSSDPPSRKKR